MLGHGRRVYATQQARRSCNRTTRAQCECSQVVIRDERVAGGKCLRKIIAAKRACRKENWVRRGEGSRVHRSACEDLFQGVIREVLIVVVLELDAKQDVLGIGGILAHVGDATRIRAQSGVLVIGPERLSNAGTKQRPRVNTIRQHVATRIKALRHVIKRVSDLARKHVAQALLKRKNRLVCDYIRCRKKPAIRGINHLTRRVEGVARPDIHRSATGQTDLGEDAIALVDVPIDERARDGLEVPERHFDLVEDLARGKAVTAHNAIQNPYDGAHKHRPKLGGEAAIKKPRAQSAHNEPAGTLNMRASTRIVRRTKVHPATEAGDHGHKRILRENRVVVAMNDKRNLLVFFKCGLDNVDEHSQHLATRSQRVTFGLNSTTLFALRSDAVKMHEVVLAKQALNREWTNNIQHNDAEAASRVRKAMRQVALTFTGFADAVCTRGAQAGINGLERVGSDLG